MHSRKTKKDNFAVGSQSSSVIIIILYRTVYSRQGGHEGRAKGGPGLLIFWKNENKRIFKVCVSSSCRCAGTCRPIALPLTVSYLCSSESNIEVDGALKSVVSARRDLQRSETKTRKLLRGTDEKSVSSTRSLIHPPGKSRILSTHLPPHIWLPAPSLVYSRRTTVVYIIEHSSVPTLFLPKIVHYIHI